jgi:hypothetical protein
VTPLSPVRGNLIVKGAPKNGPVHKDSPGPTQSNWPELQMANSGKQDACKSVTLNFSFTNAAQG